MVDRSKTVPPALTQPSLGQQRTLSPDETASILQHYLELADFLLKRKVDHPQAAGSTDAQEQKPPLSTGNIR